jgi:hypothetical protein
MAGKRTYRNEALNPSPTDRLEPIRVEGVLAGLVTGQLLIPRPVLGVEHEHNIAVRLPNNVRGAPDDIGIDALLGAATECGARPARGARSSANFGACDRNRLVFPGPQGMPIQFYDDLSKFEQVFGEFTSARRLLAVREALLPSVRRIIARANEQLAEQFGADPQLLVHLSGGDGDSTCATLHLNIPWANEVAHAAYVSLEAFHHLQETLARQLAIMTSVAATGMPGEHQLLAEPRSTSFGRIIGFSTLEPHRAMQFNRLQGRAQEGYEQEGCGRNMQMVAAWGQSQVGNFLTATLNQLETLRLHLVVTGLYSSSCLLRDRDNLLTLAARLATDRVRAAELMRRTLDDYHHLTAFLVANLGESVMEELVPDYQEALSRTDTVLTAIEGDDQDTLVKTNDYAKKEFLVDQFLAGRGGGWESNLPGIRNICFAFASPQEVSPYFDYFRRGGLEEWILSDTDVEQAGPDPLTRSYFYAEVVRRFWDDPLIDLVEFDWDRLTLRQSVVVSGGWVPRINLKETSVLVPRSVGHHREATGPVFDRHIHSLQDVFDVFGTSTPHTTAATHA